MNQIIMSLIKTKLLDILQRQEIWGNYEGKIQKDQERPMQSEIMKPFMTIVWNWDPSWYCRMPAVMLIPLYSTWLHSNLGCTYSSWSSEHHIHLPKVEHLSLRLHWGKGGCGAQKARYEQQHWSTAAASWDQLQQHHLNTLGNNRGRHMWK